MLNCSGPGSGGSLMDNQWLLLSTHATSMILPPRRYVQNPQLCINILYWHHWNNISLQGQNVTYLSTSEFEHVIKSNWPLNRNLIIGHKENSLASCW